MTRDEALKFAEEMKEKLSYRLECAQTVPARSYCEKQDEMLTWAIAALREQEERVNPKPLTLKEMLELDGIPVWTVTIGLERTGRWEIITCETNCSSPLKRVLRGVNWSGDMDWYELDTYGKTWIAYRHKPQMTDDFVEGNNIAKSTKTDRIRAMSDEESAVELGMKQCPDAERWQGCSGECEACWLRWLREPAEATQTNTTP